MRRKFFPVFLLFTIYCLLFAKVSFAQTVCDLCGKCEGGEEPSDYSECVDCLYDATGKLNDGVSWTVIGCLPTTPGGFTQAVVGIFSSIAGGISFIVFLYGGFKVLTSSGDPQKLSSGKSLMAAAIIAGFLIVFSVFIFRFVAIQVLKLPGFGG